MSALCVLEPVCLPALPRAVAVPWGVSALVLPLARETNAHVGQIDQIDHDLDHLDPNGQIDHDLDQIDTI